MTFPFARTRPENAGKAAGNRSLRPPLLIGRYTGVGIVSALLVALVDQLTKLWLIFVFDLGSRGFVKIAPIFDLVLTWNTGISYGLLQQNGELGRWLLLAFKAIAVCLLWIWLARAASRLTAVAVGLIRGSRRKSALMGGQFTAPPQAAGASQKGFRTDVFSPELDVHRTADLSDGRYRWHHARGRFRRGFRPEQG